MIVRSATADDAAALVELTAQLGYPVSLAQLRERLAALPADSEIVLVAQDHLGIAGWTQLGIARAIESAPHVEIRALVVDQARRAQGIGRLLVDAGAQWANTLGYPSLRVRCNVTRNATHAFYQALGFTESKRQIVFARGETP